MLNDVALKLMSARQLREHAASRGIGADEIEDTTKEMTDTQAFIANLASMCATKKKEWAERSQMRSLHFVSVHAGE